MWKYKISNYAPFATDKMQKVCNLYSSFTEHIYRKHNKIFKIRELIFINHLGRYIYRHFIGTWINLWIKLLT